jgi:hypothetical protein
VKKTRSSTVEKVDALAAVKCVAMACTKTRRSVDPALFCKGHLKMLPGDLQLSSKYRDAVVFLGRLEGYLVADPGLKGATIVDVTIVDAREYV